MGDGISAGAVAGAAPAVRAPAHSPGPALTVGGGAQAAKGEQQQQRPEARDAPPLRAAPAGRVARLSALPVQPHRRAGDGVRGQAGAAGGEPRS